MRTARIFCGFFSEVSADIRCFRGLQHGGVGDNFSEMKKISSEKT